MMRYTGHDHYDTDVMTQLIRIADALEKIEKKLPDGNVSQIEKEKIEPAKRPYSCENCSRSMGSILCDDCVSVFDVSHNIYKRPTRWKRAIDVMDDDLK